MYFLFSDDEFLNSVVYAKSWREALKETRDKFSIKGRLRIKTQCDDYRVYSLDDSAGYQFKLKMMS